MKMKFLLKAAFYTIWVSFAYTTVLGQGLETFENHSLSGTSYVNGSFVGNNDITWYYVHCTGEQAYPIENKGILLRRSEVPSSVSSSTISGGIGNFSVQMRKAFTSTGDRQIELFINGESKGVSQTFGAASGGDETIHTFTVNNINIDGDFVIEIRHITGNTSNRQLVIDNLTWTGYSSGGNQSPIISSIIRTPHLVQQSDPVSISAEVVNATSVELRWGLSSGSLENVIPMVVWGQNIYVTPSEIPTHYNGTTIYYAVYAEGEGGQETSPTYNYMVRPVVYEETFEVDLGECQTYSVSGETKQWVNISGTAQMYGDNSGDTEEDWLILPSQNLDEQDLLLSFDSWKRYGVTDANNYLKLYYSSNYPGQGDPTQFTWTELAFTQPETDQVWTPSGTIDLSNITGSSVYIGFKYLYTAGNYVWWDIDNIKLERKTYSVTFNVVDGTMPTGTDPINTATVDFYGAEKITNEAGDAVYTWVETDDNIPYAVTKSGYHNFIGTLNVANNNLIQQVKMLSSKVAINISADPDVNTASISWVGTGAEVYRIRYRVVGSSSYLYLNVPSSPAIINVFPETNYEVTVSSKIDGIWSNYSTPTTFTTIAGSQVVASNITVTDITGSSATINWDGAGADQYRIRYNIAGTTSFQYLNSTSSPTAIPVFPESTYDVSVASMVGGVWLAYTNPVRFETPTGAQASNVTVTNITSSTAQVNWNGSGADRYRIMYRVDGSLSYIYVDTYFSPRTISVLPETTYEVRVASRVAGIWYPYTSPVKFSTPAVTPKVSPADNVGNEMLSNLLLYPNPASDYVHLQVSLNQNADITISVFDISGSMVKMEKLYNQFGIIDARIELEGFSKGIYIVRVVSMEQVESIRMIVQ